MKWLLVQKSTKHIFMSLFQLFHFWHSSNKVCLCPLRYLSLLHNCGTTSLILTNNLRSNLLQDPKWHRAKLTPCQEIPPLSWLPTFMSLDENGSFPSLSFWWGFMCKFRGMWKSHSRVGFTTREIDTYSTPDFSSVFIDIFASLSFFLFTRASTLHELGM